MIVSANSTQPTPAATTTSAQTSSASGSSFSAAAGKGKGAMGQTEFLKLLVTQMKNQDPTNPMDNQQLTAQMAQFSSLEQLMNINSGLSNLLSASNSTTSAQALTLIGKEVTVQGHNTYMTGGKAADISMGLSKEAAAVTVTIEDQNGNVVRKITTGRMAAGEQSLKWDGNSDAGSPLPDGMYTYSVDAKDTSGKPVDVTTYAKGVVSTISFDKGVAYVHIGDLKFMLSEIVQVNNSPSATGATPPAPPSQTASN
jgi:flagellar basal-body rod modification protein FlgD